jgi:hypothetical protein
MVFYFQMQITLAIANDNWICENILTIMSNILQCTGVLSEY